MRRLTTRRWLEVLIGAAVAVAAFVAVVVFPMWRSAINDSLREQSAEPFRIAGNLYYVGGSDSTAFLLTGPQGHVLIDGGYAATSSMIIESIATLGFDIHDVKVLLNSEATPDHAGGLAALQEASGAQLWASEASAPVLVAGGEDAAANPLVKLVAWTGLSRYPGARVDRQFKDDETIRLGTTAITAHSTPGNTRGCTSYSFQVRDGERVLNVVSACTVSVVTPFRYRGYEADFERTFRVLRSLPADIWVTSHAREWGRYRKFVASKAAKNPADPFIDPEGYRNYVVNGEASFRAGNAQ